MKYCFLRPESKQVSYKICSLPHHYEVSLYEKYYLSKNVFSKLSNIFFKCTFRTNKMYVKKAAGHQMLKNLRGHKKFKQKWYSFYVNLFCMNDTFISIYLN